MNFWARQSRKAGNINHETVWSRFCHLFGPKLIVCLREPAFVVNYWASLVAQKVKNPPAMQETWVRSLGQEDPLEKEMATHSSILAWRIPRTEKPGRLWSMGLQRVGPD